MTETVIVKDDGAVRVIRMNRPEKKNALTLPMYIEMVRALREADASDAIRCVVFAGAAGAFTAGNDLADFLNTGDADGINPKALEFLYALVRSQKPLVAAVNGLAIGVGATMLFHCDHVVASADTRLTTPFLQLALIPEAASSLLGPLRMGHARAFSFLVMGRPLSAAEAHAAGLVNTVVDAAGVEDTAMKAAHEIAALPPGAVAVSRRLLRGDPEAVVKRIDEEATHFKERLKSDEARAAFKAFLSRKK
jgi:enoyl-CoA hydratase/carnithine racemase